MSDGWTVRFDSRVKEIVAPIAHREQREPAQVLRRLVDSALAERAMSAGTNDRAQRASV
jgi:hypothetical protein